MIVPGSNTSNIISDESEDDVDSGEVDTYCRKYQLLLERCEILQQDNERLVHRIQQVRKLLRRSRKERRFLMDRLDLHGDNWRNAPLPLPLAEELSGTSTTQDREVKMVSTPYMTTEKVSRKGGSSQGSSAKRKNRSEKERDPNAPKKPANPFFQFCQEQRPILTEQYNVEHQEEPTKQEMTKLLAIKWNSLTTEDKKLLI